MKNLPQVTQNNVPIFLPIYHSLLMLHNTQHIYNCTHYSTPIFSYTFFTYIYYEAGGTNELGDRWVYEPLDWSKPAQAGIVTAGAVVGIVLIHFSLYTIYLGDKHIALKVCGASNKTDPDRVVQIVTKDDLKKVKEDEVKVKEEGGRWAQKSATPPKEA